MRQSKPSRKFMRALEIAPAQVPLNGVPVEIAKDTLLLGVDHPTLALEDLHPQLLNVRGITIRPALTDLEVIPADRFRRGEGPPRRHHAADQMLVLGRAAAQAMQVPIKIFQSLCDAPFAMPYLVGVYPSIYGSLSH